MNERPSATHSTNPVQARAIESDLIINLVRLPNYAVDDLVLRINLFAHGLTKSVQSFSTAMNRIPVTLLVIVERSEGRKDIQIVVDLVLHLLVLTISLKLVLRPLSKTLLRHRLTNGVPVDVPL